MFLILWIIKWLYGPCVESEVEPVFSFERCEQRSDSSGELCVLQPGQMTARKCVIQMIATSTQRHVIQLIAMSRLIIEWGEGGGNTAVFASSEMVWRIKSFRQPRTFVYLQRKSLLKSKSSENESEFHFVFALLLLVCNYVALWVALQIMLLIELTMVRSKGCQKIVKNVHHNFLKPAVTSSKPPVLSNWLSKTFTACLHVHRHFWEFIFSCVPKARDQHVQGLAPSCCLAHNALDPDSCPCVWWAHRAAAPC